MCVVFNILSHDFSLLVNHCFAMILVIYEDYLIIY